MRPWFLEGVGLAGSYTKVFLPQLVYTVVAKKHHLKKTNKNQQRYGVGTQNCFFLELRWASIYGVAQSRTRLRRLSSSSSRVEVCSRYQINDSCNNLDTNSEFSRNLCI